MIHAASITVVGIGADGWSGLGKTARRAVADAEVLMGSARQLALVPGPGTRLRWPTPLLPALPRLLEKHRDRRITSSPAATQCSTASG